MSYSLNEVMNIKSVIEAFQQKFGFCLLVAFSLVGICIF